jgi:hypothetical protein
MTTTPEKGVRTVDGTGTVMPLDRRDRRIRCRQGALMARYHFVTEFSLPAPPDRVWDVLADPTTWPV